MITAVGILFFVLGSIVFAQLGVPHNFKGTVTVNGAPAQDGLLVIAKIDGKTVTANLTKDGGYGYSPNIFLVQDPGFDRVSKTIEFFIHDFKAAERIFSNGLHTNLDLVVNGNLGVCGDNLCSSSESCSSCSEDCGSCPPPSPAPGGDGGTGGGGGGGGGGGLPRITALTSAELEESSECTPDWVCSDWIECSSGQQKRVCVDANRCETDENRPEGSRECEVSIDLDEVAKSQKKIIKGKPTGLNAITGAFTGIIGNTKGSIVALVAIIVIIGLFFVTGKILTKNSKK